MKKIAITQRITKNNAYYEVRDALDTRWSSLFKAIDLLPVIIPSQIDLNFYLGEFDIDGIFLTGGNDLQDFNKDIISKQRDKLEFDLISYAIDNHIPIFGVCRGMQIIAKYFDSTFKVTDNHVGSKHQLISNVQSKHFSHLSRIKIVNSYHKYSIEKIGKDLIISAESDDNVIEALEHNRLKIFAQMWHPERENPFNLSQLDLIKNFFYD